MASADVFAPLTLDEIRAALRGASDDKTIDDVTNYNRAVDFLHDKQLDHTRTELRKRYPTRQGSGSDSRIQAVTLPLTARYICEAATAYNKPIKREVVNDEGVVQEDETKILNDELADVGYSETMHYMEQISLLLGVSGLWIQAKRGKLAVQAVVPHKIHPVKPLDPTFMDVADQQDYLGHVIELNDCDADDDEKQSFVFLTPAEHIYYQSTEWHEISDRDVFDNPFMWPQVADTLDGKGQEADYPLQMLSLWHKTLPTGCLMSEVDAGIALLNLDMNVQWSVMLDTLAHQGWGQIVLNVTNPGTPPSHLQMGSGFALSLGAGESAASLSHANDYASMSQLLKTFLQVMAMAQSQSPNDFAVDGTGPASGFAKLVDSLPKLEARQKRIRRLTSLEENFGWPRIASVLTYLGKFKNDVSGFRMRVEFPPVEFPKTVVEENQKQEHDFKWGLSSPSDVLVKRTGITKEEADEKIIENLKGEMPGEEPSNDAPIVEPPPVTPSVDSLLKLVEQVRTDKMSKAAAMHIMTVSFAMSEDDANAILVDAEKQAAEKPASPPPQFETPPEPPPKPEVREEPDKTPVEGLLAKVVARAGKKQ